MINEAFSFITGHLKFVGHHRNEKERKKVKRKREERKKDKKAKKEKKNARKMRRLVSQVIILRKVFTYFT